MPTAAILNTTGLTYTDKMEDEIKIEPISALQKALEERPKKWIKLENWVNPFENDVKMKLSPLQEIILASAYINGALPDRSQKRGSEILGFIYGPITQAIGATQVKSSDIIFQFDCLANCWLTKKPLLNGRGNLGCLHFYEDGTVWAELGCDIPYCECKLSEAGLKYVMSHRLVTKYIRKLLVAIKKGKLVPKDIQFSSVGDFTVEAQIWPKRK